jgi:hypothetical protein
LEHHPVKEEHPFYTMQYPLLIPNPFIHRYDEKTKRVYQIRVRTRLRYEKFPCTQTESVKDFMFLMLMDREMGYREQGRG